jgi:signal transduction histidine kinase
MLDPRGRVVMTNTRMSEFWTFANTNLTPRSVEQISRDPLSSLGEGLGYQEGQLSAVLGRYTRNPIVKPETDLYEVRGASGQRQRFVERTTTAVRDEQGNFIGLLLIFHDVTKQKELDEARENLTQLIVHDLRSPLQSVMGSMRLINQFLPEKPAEVEQATQISERAVKKLLNLVNNLLDISSMESGKFSLRAEVESAASIIRDVADTVIGLSEDANAVVKVELPAELPFVEVDRSMIERVVLNLVDNALKHTTPGTLVRVTAAKQAASEAAAGPMVLIQVIDNGPGVPNDFKEKIFDRFTQVPGQKSQRRSTGLGLAFCLMAVENHGGKIWVEDNPDGGSIFSVLLPAASVPVEHITERTKTAEAKPIKPIRSKGAGSETPKKSASAKSAPSD